MTAPAVNVSGMRWAHTPEDKRKMVEEARAAGRKVVVRRIKTSADDCLNRCVAAMLQIPYEDTPPVVEPSGDPAADGRERGRRWQEWAKGRGLRMWVSDELMPVHLDRWIASVDALDDRQDGATHAVLMSGRELFYDPNEEGDSPHYEQVRLTDVRRAMTFIPAEQDGLSGSFVAIARRVPLTPPERTDP